MFFRPAAEQKHHLSRKSQIINELEQFILY